MQLAFQKYQGLGNDFIVIEGDEARLRDVLNDTRVRRWCDRNFGIGADGVLLVTPAHGSAARMIVLNADGSRPEMCGNGLRCVALHLATTRELGGTFDVLTDAGVRRCELSRRGSTDWITLSLGKARLDGPLVFEDDSVPLTFHQVNVGNPHAVLLGHTFTIPQIDTLGPAVSARVKGGLNVEFTRLESDGTLDVVVWERGVGRTLACGTGAGAAVAAAAQAELVPFDAPVRVQLPGGLLEVAVSSADLSVQLGGPAVHVFSGSIEV